jgi:hypothetical protein
LPFLLIGNALPQSRQLHTNIISSSSSPKNKNSTTEVRAVVQAISRNVQDLVAVLCSPSNAELFLRFGQEDATTSQPENALGMEGPTAQPKPPVNAAIDAGPLATLLHSCATNLPLQTPSYAALTLGVECTAPESHAKFALRVVELGMKCLGRDLDVMLDCKQLGAVGTNNEEQDEKERCLAEKSGGHGNGMQIDAYYRAKLMLRFLAHLTNVGIVAGMQQEQQHTGNSMSDGQNLSLFELLQLLVQCACNAASASSGRASLRKASVVLASLVLSTIPYLNLDELGASVVYLLEEIETHVLGQSYSSDFEPGIGWQAILLKGELDDGETMDDDEEDDDDENDSPAPSCADTLQDLLRTVRKVVDVYSQNGIVQSRFALLRDAPWKSLKIAATTEGMDVEEGGAAAGDMVAMLYSGEPLFLDLLGSEEDKRCKCVPYLLSLDGGDNDNIQLNCRLLDGIVFGRLAIFDAPPDSDDEDDDEEEEVAEKDPNLESYVKSFSLVDRFFLADTIRDVLMCHRPMVSDAGADRSAAKEVAEQLWMISHLFFPAAPLDEGGDMSSTDTVDVSKGIEYGIVETLLSLIVQSTPRECDVPATSALNQHLYLARVLLELTKLKPALVPRATVRAVSGLFEDFIPSLTSVARDNLATWLSIHLFNTDYQWPKSFWDHWSTYVTAGPTSNSRCEFVTLMLHSMAGLSSDGAVGVVKDCLPPGCSLVQSVFLAASETSSISPAELDLVDRFWKTNQDPDAIRQFVISDELTNTSDAIEDGSEDHSMFHRSVWWRTGLATRALLHPAVRDREREIQLVTSVLKQTDNFDDSLTNNEIDEVDPTEDLLSDLSDSISRFKPVLLAALAKDADAYDSIATGRVDDDQLLLAGEVSILREFENVLPSWDTVTLNVLIQSLMKNKIVSPLSVATWAIGDKSSSSPRVASSQWWKHVTVAINHAISSVEGSSTDLGGGIGMIIDDTGNHSDSSEAAAKRLDEALKIISPALKCVVEQSINVLASIEGDKKIPPRGADATEGTKRLFSATLFLLHYHFCLEPPTGMQKLHFMHVLKGLAGTDLGWDKIASSFQFSSQTCKGNGSKLLQSISTSFEKVI